jgi:hypothetical protein
MNLPAITIQKIKETYPSYILEQLKISEDQFKAVFEDKNMLDIIVDNSRTITKEEFLILLSTSKTVLHATRNFI